jgi:hypothetical protein
VLSLVTAVQMSRLACNFCAHVNPEGSTFCTRCGSPLNLTRCSRCGSINVLSVKQCSECGAPLSWATRGEMATPPVALTETAQSADSAESTESAESAPTKRELVPIPLAERLEARPEQPNVTSNELQANEPQAIVEDEPSLAAAPEPEATVEDEPSLAAAPQPQATVDDEPSLAAVLTADSAVHVDHGSPSAPDADRATYPRRNPNRARVFLVVVVFVAVAGAAYWTLLNPTHPPDTRTMTGGASTTAPEPAPSAPAAAPQTVDTPTESPTEKAEPSTAGSSESAATIPPSANVEPPAAAQAPKSVDAQAPAAAAPAKSLDGGTAKTKTARATAKARRTVPQGHKKKQAQRDATATRRLATRELADTPPAGSDERPPPGP